MAFASPICPKTFKDTRFPGNLRAMLARLLSSFYYFTVPMPLTKRYRTDPNRLLNPNSQC